MIARSRQVFDKMSAEARPECRRRLSTIARSAKVDLFPSRTRLRLASHAVNVDLERTRRFGSRKARAWRATVSRMP